MKRARAGTGRRARVALVLGALLLVVVGTACWPEEGYDAARTGFNPFESALSAANVGGLSRAWGVDTGATATTPVVVINRVFVGAGDAVEAFGTATGGTDWVTHNNDSPNLGPGEVGPLSAVGGNVFAPVNWGGDLAGLFTFNDTTGARSGSAEAHRQLLGSVAERSDASASVVFSFVPLGDTFTTMGYGNHTALLGFNTSPTVTSPSIIGRNVLVGVNTRIESFSLDTCTRDPRFPVDFCLPQWTADLPALPRDPVGLGTTAAAIGLSNGDVAVLDLATGALKWTAHTGATAVTAPAVANGHLYVGAGDGRLYAFSASGCGQATCAPEWSGATASGATVSHQPAVANGVVYIGTSTGAVYAFAAAGCGMTSCPSLWSGAVNPSGPAAPVLGPVVDGGTVYASAGSTLAAFRLAPTA